jgi:GPH family glycoside/pentoside/hexuronide:cation symporter
MRMPLTGELSAEDLPPRDRIEDVVARASLGTGPSHLLYKLRAGFVLIPICHSAGMNLITMLAFRFITDNLAISAGAAGLMFALVKIYDGILDPLVGAWSDKLKSPFGRRLPFIFAGSVLMPLSIVAVFGAPDFGSVVIAQVLITLALMVHATAYTALTIPGFAMAVEATDDFDERTSLMAYRVFGNSVGTLIGTALPAWLLSYWGATREGHLLMALVIAGIILAAGVACSVLMLDAPRTQRDPRQDKVSLGMAGQMRLAWQNQPFRVLAIAHIFVLFAVSIGSSSGAYFSKYVLGLPDAYLGSFYSLMTVGSVGSMPVWVWACRKLGKKVAYMVAMGGYGLLHVLWATGSGHEAVALLVLRGLLTGVTAGGVILCAYSMMSDAVRYDYITSGLRREGAFAGFTTLFDKLASAAALSVMGIFMGRMGYISSTGAHVTQPASAVLAIKLCITVLPPAAILAAILVVSRYSLTPRMLEEGQAAR